MAEELPDGTRQGYTGICAKCRKSIPTNLYGHEDGTHECISSDLNELDAEFSDFMHTVAGEPQPECENNINTLKMKKPLSDDKLTAMGLYRTQDGRMMPIGTQVSPRVIEASERAVNVPKHIDSLTGYDMVDAVNEVTGLEIAFPALVDEMAQYYSPKVLHEKKWAYVGIDPGKNGGIIALVGHDIVGKWIIPLSGDKIDLQALYGIFIGLKEQYQVTVILEEVHSIFGTSAESNFIFGFVCGAIEAIVIAHGLRLNKVQPKEWQTEIWQNGDKVWKPKKPEQKRPSIDTKATSLNAAKRLYPGFDFRKSDSARVTKDHDGLIDASCLVEFARRKNL